MSEQSDSPVQTSEIKCVFVNKTFDEFTNTATTTHIKEVKYEAGSKFPISFVFRLARLKTKDDDATWINCRITKKAEKILGGFGAKDGRLIFNCDQDVFELKFRESKSTNARKSFDYETFYSCCEIGYYLIEVSQLKQICEAKMLKIRISGKDSRAEPSEKFCAELQKHCRQFYNNVFDSSLYLESLIEETPKLEQKPTTDKMPEGKKKSGCFVATACYGNYDHPVVMELRHFRDDCLETSTAGRAFVRWYYQWSPAFASFVAKNKILKTLSRVLIVAPAVMIARAVKRNFNP